MTANDLAVRRGLNREALRADGDFAVAADGNAGALAEDVGPPGTGGWGAQGPAIFFFGLVPGRLRRGANFAVLFHLVVVFAQLVQEGIGLGEVGDLLGGKKRRQPLLPEGMATLDFAFGLRGGRKAQGDAVKMEGRGQLGVSFRSVGEEEAVVIDVEAQRQPGVLKDLA